MSNQEVATVDNDDRANNISKKMSKIKTGSQIASIVPQDVDQCFRMAQIISASNMAPKDMKSNEQITVAIFHGLEIGLKPMQAVQSIAVINGRPCIWGDAALGLVQGSGLLEEIDEKIDGEGDARVAICEVRRAGKDKSIVRKFSVGDAKIAGLWVGNVWKKYPQRMLQMRARSWALRDGFADVMKGLQITEEVRDYQSSERIQAVETEAITIDAIENQAAPVVEEKIIDAEVADPKETLVEDAKKAHEKATNKLAACDTIDDVNVAFKLYAQPAIEALEEAGMNEDATKVQDAYNAVISEYSN